MQALMRLAGQPADDGGPWRGRLRGGRLGAAVVLGLMVGLFMAPCAAQVYKWTDAEGRVHYGDRKDAPAGRPAQLLKPPPSPAPAPAVGPSTAASATPPGWAWPAAPAPAPVSAPAAEPAPRSRSGGRDNGTDESRCALARDVLEGRLRHRNGAPVDAHDREVAQGDIQRFCR